MIRFAKATDVKSLAALSIQVWLETYAKDGIRAEYAEFVVSTFTAQYFADLLHARQHKIIVAEDQGYLRGFALINLDSHFESEKNGFEVEKLYIHQPFRQAGFGRDLLNFIRRELGQAFWLYTWVENESNGYYEHVGFRKIGKHTFRFYDWDIENHVYVFDS